ncbi:MAG TPA: metallopeptidase TldD-related protein [Gemmatimonadales bacterium]
MIDRLVAAIRRRADGGDALWRQTEHTTVAFESGRLKACGITEETGINLRVVRGGRVGVAGTTTADLDDLVARALASAELGEAVDLAFPAAAALPEVAIHAAGAAAASLDRLTAIGAELVARLTRAGCQINVSIEREITATRVVGTGGADAKYQATGVAVNVDLARFAGDDVLFLSDQYQGTDLPAARDLDALVRTIDERYERALTVVEPPEGALPVVFTPQGLSAILLPLRQALSGKVVLQGISPLGARIGEAVFDPAFSLTDDPLLAHRPASRPIDDEGTPSHRLALVERGTVRAFIYDLETAARAGKQSTGHGTRGTFGKPVVEYSNMVVGTRSSETSTSDLGGGLAAGVADGLVIDELIGVGQGNVIGGAFSHPVALAYRIERGEITGRVKDAAVAGNVYELLKRIAGFGTDGRWQGTRWSPSLLLEGVSVARR